MKIVVAIEPDENGRCRDCCGCCNLAGDRQLAQWGYDATENTQAEFRGPLCLAAERRLAALVEAGNDLKSCDCPQERSVWDRAVAQMKEEER